MDIGNLRYPGRGIMLGESSKGESVSAYFITGRSENSRNRVFELRAGELYTSPADEKKVIDKSLIIYRALASVSTGSSKYLILTNGDQTDTIADYIKRGDSFEAALQTRSYEPDEPNYTSRISGIVSFANKDFIYKLSILKRSENGDCTREFYSPIMKKGYAHFIHTYSADTSPLPAFSGEPKCIEIPDDIDSFASQLWDGLDEDNRISLYVRFTDPVSMRYTERLVNKYKKLN